AGQPLDGGAQPRYDGALYPLEHLVELQRPDSGVSVYRHRFTDLSGPRTAVAAHRVPASRRPAEVRVRPEPDGAAVRRAAAADRYPGDARVAVPDHPQRPREPLCRGVRVGLELLGHPGGAPAGAAPVQYRGHRAPHLSRTGVLTGLQVTGEQRGRPHRVECRHHQPPPDGTHRLTPASRPPGRPATGELPSRVRKNDRFYGVAGPVAPGPARCETEPVYDYDILVLGSGPSGQKAAIAAAKLDRRAAIVEKRHMIGGVCINTGTIPSKTLREA